MKTYLAVPNEESVNLIGEDRNYGGKQLFVDLIPNNCWFTNVRYCVHSSEWNRLRFHIYERVDYKCECCGIDTKKSDVILEAHERWDYNEQTNTQKLMRLVALCHNCHQSTHIGLAGIRGKRVEAELHLKDVRGFTEEECKQHIKDTFNLWRERNLIEWNLDISLITNNGIKLKKTVKAEDRRDIVKKTFIMLQ